MKVFEIMVKIILFGVSIFSIFAAFMYTLEIIDYFKQDREERNDPMMYCDSCEEHISKRARYCPNCGHDYGEHNWISQSPIVQVSSVLFFIFVALLFGLPPLLIP
jgi:hypothetical protein